MTPYVLFSTALHAAVFAVFFFVVPAMEPSRKFYTVDFMGGQSGAGTGRLEPAPAPAGRGEAADPEKTLEELPDREDPKKVTVKKNAKKTPAKTPKKGKEGPPPAPRNRGKAGGRGISADGKGDIQGSKSGPVGGVGTSLEIGGFGPGGGGKADLRSPYPWYDQLVYRKLWENWDRTDAGNKSCVVSFIILRNGTIKDVKVVKTSGDAFFDIVARRAAEDAAPFPPLPDNYDGDDRPATINFQLK